MNEDQFAYLDDDEETDEVQVPTQDHHSTVEQTEVITELKKEDGHILPLSVIDEEEKQNVSMLLHKTARQESALARDIAYFGANDLSHILECYNLTSADIARKLKEPRFSALVEKYSTEIGDDYEGLMRVRARAYLETMGLTRLQQVINDPRTKDENVIKAVTLMSQLGGAMPKHAGDGNGTQIVFNFGANNPIVKSKQVIEHD